MDYWILDIFCFGTKEFLLKYISLLEKYTKYNETNILKHYYKEKEWSKEINTKDTKYIEAVNSSEIKRWLTERWIDPELGKKRHDDGTDITKKPEEGPEFLWKIKESLHEIRVIRNMLSHDHFLYIDKNEKMKRIKKEIDNFLEKIDSENIVKILSELCYYDNDQGWETQDKEFLRQFNKLLKGIGCEDLRKILD